MTTSGSPRNVFQLLKDILGSDVPTCSAVSWPNTHQHTQHLLELPINLHMLQKKRLQTEAAGHQPCNNSLLQNHLLLLKQRQWPAWSLKQMGRIQQEAQGKGFLWVFGFFGVFFCYNRGGLRLAEVRMGFGGRAEDRNNRSSHPWPHPGFLFSGEQKP